MGKIKDLMIDKMNAEREVIHDCNHEKLLTKDSGTEMYQFVCKHCGLILSGVNEGSYTSVTVLGSILTNPKL